MANDVFPYFLDGTCLIGTPKYKPHKHKTGRLFGKDEGIVEHIAGNNLSQHQNRHQCSQNGQRYFKTI